MELKKPYIFPHITVYATLDKLLSDWKGGKYSRLFQEKREKSKEQFFNELKQARGTLVLSDPGYGKTRLLEEFVSYLKQSAEMGVLIDLKLFSRGDSLENFIAQEAKLRFESLIEKNPTICFDALDELKRDSFNRFVAELKAILAKYDTIKVVISCRLLSYDKERVLENMSFAYMLIDDFEFNQVRKYLQQVTGERGQKVFPDEEIDKIIQDFSEPNWESIILIPRYLEKFIEFHLKYPDQKPTRSTLYDFFVNERLDIEDKKLGAQDRTIIRRFLEKIALLMEVYQKNDIKKDELLTIMDDINSNLAVHFFDVGKINILFDHSLWKDYGNSITYEERTLQEYLASCELLRLGGQKRLYDFTVNPYIDEIYPSWFGTLGFCVDQKIELLEPLVCFGQGKKDRVIEVEEYHRFLTKVDVTKISREQKIRIFGKVFGQYQREKIWIDWDIASRLALFFDPSLEGSLRNCLATDKQSDLPESAKHVPKGNVAQMIGFLFRNGVLDDGKNKFWKEKLIEFANDKNENGVLQRHALFALETLKDESIIVRVQEAFNHSSDPVRDAFLDLCREIAPNNKLAVEYFIKGIQQESSHAYQGMEKISEPESIKIFLEALDAKDGLLLKSIVSYERVFHDRNAKFLMNVNAVYNEEEIGRILVSIICKAATLFLHDSQFISNIADILKDRRPGVALEICDNILADQNKQKYPLFELGRVIEITLDKKSVKEMIDKLKCLSPWEWSCYQLLRSIKYQRGNEGEEIYEEGRKYLPNVYKEAEKQEAQRRSVPSELERVYGEFCHRLEPEKGNKEKYRNDVFAYFSQWQEKIKPLIKNEELSRLKELAVDVLKNFSPRKAEFKVLEWDESGRIRSFQQTSTLPIFNDCIDIAQSINVLIDQIMKQNLIDFIPFAESNVLEAILKFVPDIKLTELNYVLKVYSADNERKYFRPNNFVRLVNEKKLKEAIPVLKGFIKDTRLQSYDRREALTCLAGFSQEKEYFDTVFRENLEKDKPLADLANESLIKKFGHKAAVEWRLNEIRTRAFKFSEPKDFHFVGPQAHELHKKGFARPLMQLKDKAFLDRYMELLKFSFELLGQDKLYWSYAGYIWHIVVEYIDKLKYNGDYSVIEKLEDFVGKNASQEGINWFGQQLKNLKAEYQRYIGVPKSITECITLYNDIKSRQYMEISTAGDLIERVQNIIDKNLRRWVETEGGAALFYDQSKKPLDEPRISKILSVKLEQEMEKIGITILREPQKLDGERVDLYLSYGFSPGISIIVEVKKSEHNDLGPRKDMSRTKSFKKLDRYLQGYSARHAVLLVLNVHWASKRQWEQLMKNVSTHYKRLDRVTIIGIDAFQPN